MSGESLGKASLDLSVGLAKFKREMGEARSESDRVEDALQAVASVARVAEIELNRVKMDAATGAKSSAIADRIEHSVSAVGRAAMDANRHLEQVKLDASQAAISEVAATGIVNALDRIGDEADKTKRKLGELTVAEFTALNQRRAGPVRTTGAGVGPFGSGFGRIGLLGTAIGLGAVTAPAAAPAAVGLLAGIPALGAGAAGAIGTLVLAFQGLGKAIGGDKDAFDKLQPAQKQFVQTIRSMSDWVGRLKETASVNVFPGLTEGLKAAFSPQTTALITRSVAEFGQALGQAGAQWGRYFGSAKFQQSFGPIMQAGARNLGVLSDAALNLFDALGVLGRAATPLVNWITDSIDKGAQLASSWLRAQDATGALAGAMSEAQSSLRLVGGLLVAAGRAVAALGRALYPVAKHAVKALTDGLNALAGIINRNRGAIREIASAFLTGIVAAVKVAVAGVRLFNSALEHFVGNKASVITAITLIGGAIALALGPGAVAIAGAILAVGLIVKHWTTVAVFFRTLAIEIKAGMEWLWDHLKIGAIQAALDVVEPFSHLPGKFGEWARRAKDAMQAELKTIHPPNMDWSGAAAQAGAKSGSSWGDAFSGQAMASLSKVAAAFDAWQAGQQQNALNSLAKQGFTTDLITGKKIPTTPAAKTAAPIIPASTDVFGTPPPFDTKGAKKKPKADTSFELPFALRLAEVKAAVTKSTGDDLRVAERISTYIKGLIASHKLVGEKLIGAYQELATVTSQIAAAAQEAADKLKQFTVPLRLQVAEAKFEALGQEGNVRAVLRKIKAAAMHALKSGKLSLEGQLEAWQTIAQVNEQLKQTTKTKTDVIKANEREFLASFNDLLGGFASNFQTSSPQTDTHLYEMKHEQRRQTGYLRDMVSRTAFPDTGYKAATAGAIAG